MLKLDMLTSKDTSLSDSVHFESSCVEISERVWLFARVIRATQQVNGKWQFWGVKTP